MTATAAAVRDLPAPAARAGDPTTTASGEPRLRLVVRPAPNREPPFDDEVDHLPAVTRWDRGLPFELPAPARPSPTAFPRTDALPQPGPWTRRLLIGLIESAAGRRSLQQLNTMLTFSIARGLAADFERAAHSGERHWLHRATVASLRCTEPADGVAELSATLSTGRRVRAVALRLEQHCGRWRCTRLQLG